MPSAEQTPTPNVPRERKVDITLEAARRKREEVVYRKLGRKIGEFNAEIAELVGFTAQEFAARLHEFDKRFSVGDVVRGTIFSVDPRGLLVDIGTKALALLPEREMWEKLEVQPGDTVEAMVSRSEDMDGALTLSTKKLFYLRCWKHLQQLLDQEAVVDAEVTKTNSGGAVVKVEGVHGFIPNSQLGLTKSDELVGKILPCMIMNLSEEKQQVILSHKKYIFDRKVKTLATGDVVTGKVVHVQRYGVFVEIADGGISGLLHISKISNAIISDINAVFTPGEVIKVMIRSRDDSKGRFALSTKVFEVEHGDMLSKRDECFGRAEDRAREWVLKKAAEAEARELLAAAGEPQQANKDAPEVHLKVEAPEPVTDVAQVSAS